ncbi:MAG: glycosyltransferase family protein [Magnetococcales bacterium]|nr:glycosyltransferase family protein [Magnetococcales bacterium]
MPTPASAMRHYQEATRLLARNDPQRAEAAYRQAIRADPGLAPALNDLSLLLKKQQRFAEAETLLIRASHLLPGHPMIMTNLGNLYNDWQRWDEAMRVYAEQLRLTPDHLEARYNLALALHRQHRDPEAETAYLDVLRRHPDHWEALLNLGVLRHQRQAFREAEAAYRRAAALRPDHPDLAWNLALLLLAQGRFAEGWPLHEARHHPGKQYRTAIPIQAPFPKWQGEALHGRSLLIVTEQGFGDQIQFCRYLPLLKARGASRITLLAPSPLLPLFATLDGVDQILDKDAPLPAHDFWTFPLSLPWHFGTTPETIPAVLPYLRASGERLARWRPVMADLPGLRVGLVWRGDPRHPRDHLRSLPDPAILHPLWEVPGVSFVSLQKDDGPPFPPDRPLWQPGDALRDFADTAALILLLDLVITIDSAVAHLAGALGKPCWVMLPAHGCDWRWMLAPAHSPWYPDVMRLWRQSTAGDWEEPVRQITRALRQRAAAADR